jgi:Skp family chaperone for outer membrane proteins
MIRVNSPRAAIVSMVALLVGAAMVAPAFAASPTTPAAPLSNGTNAPPPVPAPIIMIIDYEGIIAVSKAGKSISAQIDTQRTAMQKDLAQRENDLRTEQGDLEKQHATMQQDAFEAKAREFQQKVAAYQRDAQLRERALGQGVNDAKQKLTEALTEVVQQLAGERGANLVLYKTQVPLYETSYDASQEALKRLDVKLPNLALVIPKPSEVAGGQPAPAAAAASTSGTATKAAAPAAAPAKKK